jgi:dTDP-4-dehydrorhamnose 3,5-epimerase
MVVESTHLPGLRVVEVPRFVDERGWFSELWNEARYREAGLPHAFVQANVSYSEGGVLRGMHFQHPRGQGKLISVLSGTIFDAVVDVRVGSPTFGQWYGCELSDANRRQLWAPPGFAHGFVVLSDAAVVHYNCTTLYDASCDRALAWDDPEVGIEWPVQPRIISEKDRSAARLEVLVQGGLPGFDDRGVLPA